LRESTQLRQNSKKPDNSVVKYQYMKKEVVIYGMDTCHYCHLAKEYFGEKGVEYEEYDVMGDPDRRREAQERSGQMGVPVIIIDDEVIVGFVREKIDQLLET